jgi:hypothetical protein
MDEIDGMNFWLLRLEEAMLQGTKWTECERFKIRVERGRWEGEAKERERGN